MDLESIISEMSRIRSRLVAISLRHRTEWESYRLRGASSPVKPHCPRCDSELSPSIAETREDYRDGNALCYRTVWIWDFRCGCGFAEQAKTAWFTDRFVRLESPDGYRRARDEEESYEILVSHSSVRWVDHFEKERGDLRKRMDELIELRRNMMGY